MNNIDNLLEYDLNFVKNKIKQIETEINNLKSIICNIESNNSNNDIYNIDNSIFQKNTNNINIIGELDESSDESFS